jgi:hypothetical protein
MKAELNRVCKMVTKRVKNRRVKMIVYLGASEEDDEMEVTVESGPAVSGSLSKTDSEADGAADLVRSCAIGYAIRR